MGGHGSPYSLKMLSVLRYRRIPHLMISAMMRPPPGKPSAKVHLMPTFYLPAEGDDGGEIQAIVDSTPLIRRFEREFEGRSILPDDPVIAWLNDLLEDYGDEWMTKFMFHFRWAAQQDIENAAEVLALHRDTTMHGEAAEAQMKAFAKRQIDRLYVVGSNDITRPLIEEGYRRFLRLFDTHLRAQPYLLGTRPASCDFAFYGQLTQLALFDPTPVQITHEESPRTVAWVHALSENSGFEPADDGFIGRDQVPETLRALLSEVGRSYVPVMLANVEALASGADTVECEVEGKVWSQKPFPYQGKCVQSLRESYEALAPDDRKAVDAILAGTGCEQLVADR
ncbi:MAG: glutathione S-transferase C-terminal domain-containing protein [Deltaproteobacteria bacterium]|nr:glutathione S-transferase C-terminal domain-containing protein [Deltaproteobacteria bacterium]MBW2724480.1 glutathione S-transferase C-terminal domain-containing protein [Deltaproteobacteria bacterium]